MFCLEEVAFSVVCDDWYHVVGTSTWQAKTLCPDELNRCRNKPGLVNTYEAKE